MSNHITIHDLKVKYIETTEDKEIKVENIRMFCLGKELKDELCIYHYDIKDEMIVQAMFKKWNADEA